jgi:hypothetical protein
MLHHSIGGHTAGRSHSDPGEPERLAARRVEEILTERAGHTIKKIQEERAARSLDWKAVI